MTLDSLRLEFNHPIASRARKAVACIALAGSAIPEPGCQGGGISLPDCVIVPGINECPEDATGTTESARTGSTGTGDSQEDIPSQTSAVDGGTETEGWSDSCILNDDPSWLQDSLDCRVTSLPGPFFPSDFTQRITGNPVYTNGPLTLQPSLEWNAAQEPGMSPDIYRADALEDSGLYEQSNTPITLSQPVEMPNTGHERHTVYFEGKKACEENDDYGFTFVRADGSTGSVIATEIVDQSREYFDKFNPEPVVFESALFYAEIEADPGEEIVARWNLGGKNESDETCFVPYVFMQDGNQGFESSSTTGNEADSGALDGTAGSTDWGTAGQGSGGSSDTGTEGGAENVNVVYFEKDGSTYPVEYGSANIHLVGGTISH